MTSTIKLNATNGGGSVALKGVANTAHAVELTMPSDIGTNGQVLSLGSVSNKTGVISFATPYSGTPLTTQGDILYRDGSGEQRLAKGTAAQVLTMNSGATAPEWADASGGMFSKAWTDSDGTETTITHTSGDTRVGGNSGADLNVTFTPPSVSTKYFYICYLHVRFSAGGQWGWRPQFTTNDGTSWTGIGNHPSYGNQHPDEIFREGFVQMRTFHPNTTNECKMGIWAQVWTNHSASIILNGSLQHSRIFLFEIADNNNFVGA